MKAERSKWFHCKTSRFLFFLEYVFKEIMQKLFQICLTPWKNKYLSIFQSFSFQLYEIIIDDLFKAAKVTSNNVLARSE